MKDMAHPLDDDITHRTCDYIGSCGTVYLTIAICSICKVCSNNTCGFCLLLFGFHFTFHSSSVFLTSVRPRPVDLKLVELVSPELRLGHGMLKQNCHGPWLTGTTLVMRGKDRTSEDRNCVRIAAQLQWQRGVDVREDDCCTVAAVNYIISKCPWRFWTR